MPKMAPLARVLLLAMGILAAFQVAVGIDRFDAFPIVAYSIAFGVLLVASLLLIILGFEILDLPAVVVISTVIPLSLSLGLVWQHLPAWRTSYLIFGVVGFLGILLTRTVAMPKIVPVLVLAVTHAIAGLTIFLLPVWLVLQDVVKPGFALVGLGGALIGLGGLLLFFLKAGKPILSRERILRVLPALLLLMTICFVVGFRLE